MVGQDEVLKRQHTTSGFLLLKVACTNTKDCAIYEMLIERNHTAERKTLSSEGNNWHVETSALLTTNVDLRRQLCPQIFLAW